MHKYSRQKNMTRHSTDNHEQPYDEVIIPKNKMRPQDKWWEDPGVKCSYAFYNGDNNWDHSEYVITYLKKSRKSYFHYMDSPLDARFTWENLQNERIAKMQLFISDSAKNKMMTQKRQKRIEQIKNPWNFGQALVFDHG